MKSNCLAWLSRCSYYKKEVVGAVLLLGLASAHAQDLPDILVNHDGLINGVQDTSGPAGGEFTYRAKVKLNAGPDATGVTLEQTLPVGAYFRSISSSPADIRCTPTLSADTLITTANQKITCGVGNVSTAFKWVDFNVVLPTVGTTWTAITSAKLPDPYGLEDGDSGLNNKDLKRNFTASKATDLGVQLSTDAAPSGVANGDSYNYLIDVTNYGPASLTADGYARVTFELPAGARLDGTITEGGWSCNPNSGPLAAGVIECKYPNPTPGEYLAGVPLPTITVPVRAQMGGDIGAAVSVDGFLNPTTQMPDGRKTNNTASIIVRSVGADYTDVSLGKTVAPTLLDASAANNLVTYTLTVKREGGALPPENIVVTDTLPTGVSFGAFAASNDPLWACTHNAALIRCTWAGGAAYTGAQNSSLPAIKFDATVPGQTAGNSVLNTANVSVKDGTEPNTANNKSSAELTFSNRAQLAISKTGPQRPVKKGEPFPYSIVLTNNGPMPIAAGTVITVTDTPSAKLMLKDVVAASSATGAACSGLPQTNTAGGVSSTCTIPVPAGGLAVGSTLQLTINAQADDITEEYARFTNTVTTGNLPGRDSEEVSATASATVSDRSGDLEITKVIQTPPAQAKTGQQITYRLTVTNKATSNQVAQDIKITDVLKDLVVSTDGKTDSHTPYPNGGFISTMLVNEASMPAYPQIGTTPAGDTKVICPAPSGSATSTERTLVCTVDYLAAGASVSVDVTIIPRVPTATPTTATPMPYANTATAYSSFINDPTPTDNTASASHSITPLVDLTVVKQVSPILEVAAGQPATYTITTKNLGPSSAQSVKMVDTLPLNAIMVGEPDAANGGVCKHSAGASPMNGRQGGTLTCEWTTDLPRGQQYVVTYKARSVGGDPVGGVHSCITGTVNTEAKMDNCVEVSTATEETDLTNNTANASISLKPAVLDVQIQMSHSDDGLVLGGTTEYTMTITNDSNADSYATNVRVRDLFPAEGSNATFSYQDGLDVAGSAAGIKTGYTSGVSSGLSAAICSQQPAVGATTGPLECVIPLMAPGDRVTIKFTMKAESLPTGASTGTIFHSATVKPAETEYMPTVDALKNNSTTDRTSTSTRANAVDYGVDKSVASTMFRPGDTVTYTLVVTNYGQTTPAPAATLTDALPQGLLFESVTGGACTTPAVGTNGTVECPVPALGKGASQTFTIVAKLDDPYTGAYPLINKARVAAPGDTNPDNDESSARTTTPPPNVAGIPTLSQWGMIVLSLLLAGFAARRMSTRQRY